MQRFLVVKRQIRQYWLISVCHKGRWRLIELNTDLRLVIFVNVIIFIIVIVILSKLVKTNFRTFCRWNFTLTFVCGFLEDFIYDLTSEMIFELTFQAVVTLVRLVIWVLPKIGKDVTVYVPRIRLVGIRQ